jgi:hypothetical protein
MDNELRDTAHKLRLLSDAAYAQAAASELSPLDITSWRMNTHHVAIWAMAAQQEAAYRDLLSVNVVMQTAALTRVADALERLLALPTGDGKSRPAE